MAGAFVQAATGQSSSAVTSLTTGSITTTSGNFIAFSYSCNKNSVPTDPASDSKSNTWTQNISSTHNPFGAIDATLGLCYSKNITGGSGHTFTGTWGGSVYCAIGACECSGLDTTAPEDTAKPSATGNSTSCNPGTLTPGSSGDLYLTLGTHPAIADTTMSASGGFTSRVNLNDASGTKMPLCVTILDSATGSQTGTITMSSSIQWAAASGTFIAAAGGGSVFIPLVGEGGLGGMRLSGSGGLAG